MAVQGCSPQSGQEAETEGQTDRWVRVKCSSNTHSATYFIQPGLTSYSSTISQESAQSWNPSVSPSIHKDRALMSQSLPQFLPLTTAASEASTCKPLYVNHSRFPGDPLWSPLHRLSVNVINRDSEDEWHLRLKFTQPWVFSSTEAADLARGRGRVQLERARQTDLTFAVTWILRRL